MSKIKVLIISEIFYPEIGSGAYRILNIFKYLKKLDYKVDILTSYPSYPEKELYEEGDFWNKEFEEELLKESKIYRVKQSKKKKTASFTNRLYIYLVFLFKTIIRLLRMTENYDVVIATTPSVFMGLLGVVAKYKFKAKFILDIRDLWPECLKGIGVFKNFKWTLKVAYLLERFILKFSDSLVINSDGFREYLVDKGYRKNISYIPNGITYEDLNKNLKIEEVEDRNQNEVLVIYTGMVGLPQNIRTIVKTANMLKGYPTIKFKIIGTGIQKVPVENLINYYNLKNIVLEKPMVKEKVLKELAKSSIAVLNLRGDSRFDLVMPGKIVDYMSMKKPIIAGVEGYTKGIIELCNCGIVVKPDDYKAMARAIVLIYKNKEICNFYGENALSYCKGNFIWDKNIERLDRTIKIVLGREYNEKGLHVCVESFHQ